MCIFLHTIVLHIFLTVNLLVLCKLTFRLLKKYTYMCCFKHQCTYLITYFDFQQNKIFLVKESLLL